MHEPKRGDRSRHGEGSGPEPLAQCRLQQRPSHRAEQDQAGANVQHQIQHVISRHPRAADGVVDRERKVQQRPATNPRPARGRGERGPPMPDARVVHDGGPVVENERARQAVGVRRHGRQGDQPAGQKNRHPLGYFECRVHFREQKVMGDVVATESQRRQFDSGGATGGLEAEPPPVGPSVSQGGITATEGGGPGAVRAREADIGGDPRPSPSLSERWRTSSSRLPCTATESRVARVSRPVFCRSRVGRPVPL